MAVVLLVDDDVDLVDANRIVLETKGHTVVAAYSAAEAREAVRKTVPDLVVVDVMMETQTVGFELARELHEEHPNLPMIMLTGVREAQKVKFRFEPDETWLPVAKFFEKPFDPVSLAAEIERILEGRK